MKTKTLIILGGVLVASVTAVVVKMHSNAETFSAPAAIVGDVLLKSVPFDSINTINVNDGKNQVELALKDGKWVVTGRDNFPANVTSVNTLTDNAFALKVQEVLPEVGKSQYGRLGLAEAGQGVKPEETGKIVSFKDGSGKELATLVVGRTQEKKPDESTFNMSGPEPAPQWIKVGGGETIYKAATGFSKLEADPKNWLDKEGGDKFFKVEKHKSIAVTGPTPEETWKVYRETDGGEIKLDAPKPGEEFDTAKASSQSSVFSYVSFDDILPAAEKDKAALDKPTHTAVIQTFDGLTYTVKVGAKVPPPAPAPGAETPATPPDAYYVSYTVEGKLDETVPAFATPEPTAPAALAADAKEEDKKKNEEAKKNYDTAKKKWDDDKKAAETTFQEQLKKKKEKLAAEQALQTRIFVVQKSTLDPIMKKRSEFMKDKAAAPAAGTATPPAPGTTPASSPTASTPKINPRATPGTPPASKPGRIEAVTPPIEVTIPPKDPSKDAPKAAPAPAPAPGAKDADAPKKPADKDKKKPK
jgi:hypothetical protein